MDDRLPDDPAIDYLSLGPFQADYRTGSGRHYFLLVSTALLTALSIAVAGIFGTFYFSDARAAAVGMGGMIAFGLLATFPLAGLFFVLDKLNWRVLLFANGLVFDRNKKVEMVLWDHVKYLFGKRVVRNGVETNHWLRIELLSGKKITLDASFPDFNTLANRVRERSQPSLLARALAELGLNKSVDFGPVKLCQDGLANTKEKITWDQVDAIRIEDDAAGKLIVSKKGQSRRWSQCAGEDFPNAELFLVLADRLRQADPGQ